MLLSHPNSVLPVLDCFQIIYYSLFTLSSPPPIVLKTCVKARGRRPASHRWIWIAGPFSPVSPTPQSGAAIIEPNSSRKETGWFLTSIFSVWHLGCPGRRPWAWSRHEMYNSKGEKRIPTEWMNGGREAGKSREAFLHLALAPPFPSISHHFWNLPSGWLHFTGRQQEVDVQVSLAQAGASCNFAAWLAHEWCLCAGSSLTQSRPPPYLNARALLASMWSREMQKSWPLLTACFTQ